MHDRAPVPVVGWIGAGRMGVAMASFVLEAGYPVVVCSRSAASRQRLVALGATEAAGPAECARAAEIVFTSVPDDRALRDVALGPNGVLANARPGSILADTSTVSTDVSEEIDREAVHRGVAYLRIPISGNAASAQRGEVTALVSGPEAAWETVRPIVAAFSKTQVYLGTGEQARIMKLVVNAIVVNTAQSLAEALTLGRKAGLDWGTMLDTLAESTIASPWLKAKTGLLRERDFTTTMTTNLILKDMDLVLAAAREHQVPMPLASMTRQLLQVLVGEGYGEDDYLMSVKLTERQSGLPPDATD
jgi:3-hydroxyisobutyrate dehydrogenase-like beta-hydroxyacid dehydrogenase